MEKDTGVEQLLATLPPQERRMLVALPYRMGVFISLADKTGGRDAWEVEMWALENIISENAAEFSEDGIKKMVLNDLLRARGEWESWTKDVLDVPSEIRFVMSALKNLFDANVLQDFKKTLMEVAFAVAMAFRENDGVDSAVTGKINFKAIGVMIARVLSGEEISPLSHVNISDAELPALLRLANALDYQVH